MKGLCWKSAIIVVALVAQIAKPHPIHKEMMNLLLDDTPKEAFKLWHFIHEKAYDLNSETGLNRYRTFKSNLKFIQEKNKAQSDYILGPGPLSDMSDEEFYQTFGGAQSAVEMSISNNEVELEENDILPNEVDQDAPTDPDLIVDWRSKLPREIIRNASGSCFPTPSVAGLQVMESQIIILKSKPFIKLSLQELIDCEDDSDHGCQGSTIDTPYYYAKKNMISSEEDYPMEGKKLKDCRRFECAGTKNTVVASWEPGNLDTCYEKSGSSCEPRIIKMIKNTPYVTYLPLFPELKLYTGGVLTPNCAGMELNSRSSTMVVGYGPRHVVATFHSGNKFGLDGYIKVSTDNCKVFLQNGYQPEGGALRKK